LRPFDAFPATASLAALAQHLPSIAVAGDAGIVTLGDVRSSVKLDDVELGIAFVRVVVISPLALSYELIGLASAMLSRAGEANHGRHESHNRRIRLSACTCRHAAVR
jgi:hypothetical protein